MQMFMIKSLCVSGREVDDAYIEFNDGLNVIQGRSNTGKTWIIKSISYLFGTNRSPFSSVTGYTDIEGIFDTKRFGTVIIKRTINDRKAIVECESGQVENGVYETDYRKKSQLYLNDLWMKILGLDETIKIPKNTRYERERISWELLSNVFIADEEEIDKSKSIILKERTKETATIASLYYLLTGDYKKGVKTIPDRKVIAGSKKAVAGYISEQIESLINKKEKQILQMEEFDGEDIESNLRDIIDSITEISNEISELREEQLSIASQINEYKRREITFDLLIERYRSLSSQYKADLQRMDFILKGEEAVKILGKNNVCPFCGGDLDDHDDSYEEAILSETKRIVSELAIIVATEKSVTEERNLHLDKIADLERRNQEIDEMINLNNYAIQEKQKKYEKYNEYTKLQTGIDLINEQLEELGRKKEETEKDTNEASFYHAKKEFKEYIDLDFSEKLNTILKECNYNVGYASWDFDTFDILLDGIPKEEDQGKGYRSFLNSVVALMLYQYFNKDSNYIKPGFLAIDTPLLGFDENESGLSGKSLKNGLYNYFINHTGNGQIIIIDNLNVMPDIDLEKAGVNVITYHKNEKNGNVYGFMPSWRKDLPKS